MADENAQSFKNLLDCNRLDCIWSEFFRDFKIGCLNRISNMNMDVKNLGLFFIYAVWICVLNQLDTVCGRVLGFALLMASLEGSLLQGISMLLAFR